MKRTILLLLAMLALPIWAANPLYQKYATETNVKYVSLSHTMLKAMSTEKTIRLGKVSLSALLPYIDQVQIVSSSSPAGMAMILGDLKTLQTNEQYLPLLTKNDRGERSFSLFRQGNNEDEFVLFTLADTYTLIIITGHFSPEQFQSFFL